MTGSAKLLALPQIGDSLAGRMEVLILFSHSTAETERCQSAYLAHAQIQAWPVQAIHTKKFDCISRVIIGGYPEMLKRLDFLRRNAWAKAYLKAIVERDIKDISAIDKLLEVPRLLKILAQHSGKLTNFTQIGGQLNLDVKTAQMNVGLLMNLFLIKRLYASLIKADKSLLGPLLETSVCSELLKIIDTKLAP